MKPIAHALLAAAALIAAASAHAQVTVKDAWVRATVPQQKATGAFMQINAAKDTKLVSASSMRRKTPSWCPQARPSRPWSKSTKWPCRTT